MRPTAEQVKQTRVSKDHGVRNASSNTSSQPRQQETLFNPTAYFQSVCLCVCLCVLVENTCGFVVDFWCAGLQRWTFPKRQVEKIVLTQGKTAERMLRPCQNTFVGSLPQPLPPFCQIVHQVKHTHTHTHTDTDTDRHTRETKKNKKKGKALVDRDSHRVAEAQTAYRQTTAQAPLVLFPEQHLPNPNHRLRYRSLHPNRHLHPNKRIGIVLAHVIIVLFLFFGPATVCVGVCLGEG